MPDIAGDIQLLMVCCIHRIICFCWLFVNTFVNRFHSYLCYKYLCESVQLYWWMKLLPFYESVNFANQKQIFNAIERWSFDRANGRHFSFESKNISIVFDFNFSIAPSMNIQFHKNDGWNGPSKFLTRVESKWKEKQNWKFQITSQNHLRQRSCFQSRLPNGARFCFSFLNWWLTKIAYNLWMGSINWLVFDYIHYLIQSRWLESYSSNQSISPNFICQFLFIGSIFIFIFVAFTSVTTN